MIPTANRFDRAYQHPEYSPLSQTCFRVYNCVCSSGESLLDWNLISPFMAIFSRYSPILSPNSFRLGCLSNNTRLSKLQHGTRSFTRSSPARSRRMKWNARSVTGSRVVSKVPYRLAATWLTPDPLNTACVFFQVCAEGWLTDYRSGRKRLFIDCPA